MDINHVLNAQKKVINAMEDREELIKEEIQEGEKLLERKRKERFFPLILAVLGTIITPMILKMIIGYKLLLPTGLPESILGGILTNMNGYTFFSIICGIAFASLGSYYGLLDFLACKKTKKFLNGLASEQIELEKILAKERQKLKELEASKEGLKQTEERGVSPHKVVSGLLDELAVSYLCGVNESFWSRLYTNGTLSRKLGKENYASEEIEKIEEYLKEKGYSRKRRLTR